MQTDVFVKDICAGAAAAEEKAADHGFQDSFWGEIKRCEEMRVESRKFSREELEDEVVGFLGAGFVAGKEGEGEGAVEEVGEEGECEGGGRNCEEEEGGWEMRAVAVTDIGTVHRVCH